MDRLALRLGTALAGALALAPLRALAQQQPPPPPTVGELVVTATRRNESVLKIPYNISAISGAELSRNGINSLAGLRNEVVGLQAADYGERGSSVNNNFVIRGITTNDIGVGESEFPNLAGPTVSNYIDDIPLFVNLKLTDIARVEVLRGPQGTLFGADSEGGTVRTIHNKPDPSRYDAWVDASVSGTVRANTPNTNVDAMVNLPVNDHAALRIDAGYERLAGYITADNAVVFNQTGTFLPLTAQPVLADPADPLTSPYVTHTLHNINYSDTWYVRADGLWKLGDRFTAEASYQHQSSFANAFNFEYPGADYVTHRLIPLDPSQTDTDMEALTLTGDFGFGTITSSSSYYNVGTRDLYDNSGIDVEYPYYYGSYPRITTTNYDFNNDHAFTQEIRLVSPRGKLFDYVVGAYYQNRRDQAYSIETVPGFAAWANLRGSGPYGGKFANRIVNYYGGTRPGTLDPADLTYDFLRDVHFTDLAAFTEVTAHLTSKWRITGGARVFKETFAQTTIQHLYNAGTTFGSDPLGTSEGSGQKTSYDAIFKANMSYDIAPRTLAYFTFSQGYRAGGANAYPIGTCDFCNDASLQNFGPDRTDNYELGIKGIVGALQYSADLYDIQWSSIQLEVDSTAGTPIIINGGGARSRGVELEAHYAVTRALKVSAGYAYTDAELTDSFDVDGGNFTGAAGTPLAGISKHQVNGAIDFTPRMFGAHEVDFHLDGSYRSAFNNQIEVQLPNFSRLDGYSLFNAYVQTDVGPHATVQLFAQNLFDAKAITARSSLQPGGPGYALTTSFDPSEFVTRPLTIGLRIVVRR
jgi:iron complex outermembrane receptor protein